jgi:uncharacterized membrane protein YjjP (DUF1212 family)
MAIVTTPIEKAMDVCLLAGRIMLQAGAETYRVEDTMTRMGRTFTGALSHSFVTPTAIIFSIEGSNSSKMIRIMERTTDLHKVMLVNQISREIGLGDLSLEDAYKKLKDIEEKQFTFPVWLQILAAAITSSCFLIMFGGSWRDVVPAFITGGLGYSGLLYIDRLIRIRFFAEFLASFIIGVVAFLFTWSGVGRELDDIIIGSVMPLVPGLLITNAIRDLMAGHLVSGLSKGAEAFLTAFAVGTGIAIVLAFI